MAVVTVKSAAITNRDATPVVLNNARITGAPVQRAAGIVAMTNGDSAASKFLIAQVPSNAIISSAKLSVLAGGTTGAGDLGVYQTTANGGAVVDADFFASAVSVVAALTKSEVIGESGVYNPADMEKPLWQALGLTADSARFYDIVLTLTTAVDATKSLLGEVEYTV